MYVTLNVTYMSHTVYVLGELCQRVKMYQPGECRNTQAPTLFDYKSDDYLNYFCFGWFCPIFSAWRLGDKYKVSFYLKSEFFIQFQAEM